MTPAEWVAKGSWVALTLLALAIVVATYRLIRGPSLPDRVAAGDLIGMLAAGMIGVACIAAGDSVFLDVGIVLALISFLATVAIARYIERGAGR